MVVCLKLPADQLDSLTPRKLPPGSTTNRDCSFQVILNGEQFKSRDGTESALAITISRVLFY